MSDEQKQQNTSWWKYHKITGTKRDYEIATIVGFLMWMLPIGILKLVGFFIFITCGIALLLKFRFKNDKK